MTGDELRDARDRLGLTQHEMARACNVNQPHYSAWESDRKHMSAIAVRAVELLLASPRVARRFAKSPE